MTLVVLLATMLVGVAVGVQAAEGTFDPGFPEFSSVIPLVLPLPVEEPVNACVGVPTLSNVKIGPQNIWAPTEKEVEIDISGTVVVASGCEVNGTYTIDNNGGPVSGNLDIDIAGNFAVKFPIKVTKDPKAKGGTIYNGTLSVVDAVGSQNSQSFVVQVDHDRGK